MADEPRPQQDDEKVPDYVDEEEDEQADSESQQNDEIDAEDEQDEDAESNISESSLFAENLPSFEQGLWQHTTEIERIKRARSAYLSDTAALRVAHGNSKALQTPTAVAQRIEGEWDRLLGLGTHRNASSTSQASFDLQVLRHLLDATQQSSKRTALTDRASNNAAPIVHKIRSEQQKALEEQRKDSWSYAPSSLE